MLPTSSITWTNCVLGDNVYTTALCVDPTDDSDYPELRGYSPYDEEAEPVPRTLTSEELSRTEPYTPLDKKVVGVTSDT